MSFGCHGEIVQTDFVQAQMNLLASAACPMNWQPFPCAGIAATSAAPCGFFTVLSWWLYTER